MKARSLSLAILGLTLGPVPFARAHPHEPHPMRAPAEGSIQNAKEAAALPADAKVAIVDGSHHPEMAGEILKALAAKPNLRELKIYGATKWPENSLGVLQGFKRLEVLCIFDDSTRRKPGFLRDIGKVQTLRTLQLNYSGD